MEEDFEAIMEEDSEVIMEEEEADLNPSLEEVISVICNGDTTEDQDFSDHSNPLKSIVPGNWRIDARSFNHGASLDDGDEINVLLSEFKFKYETIPLTQKDNTKRKLA